MKKEKDRRKREAFASPAASQLVSSKN